MSAIARRIYEVQEVRAGAGIPLDSRGNFLDASDFAFDSLAEHREGRAGTIITGRARNLGRERGQVVVLAVFLMMSLLGFAALVLDVGSWFRGSRHVQQIADAAALAGAQALPYDPSSAQALALQYAKQNGDSADVNASDISFKSQVVANDTIVVTAHENEPGFLAKLFGINSVNIRITAAAVTEAPSAARFVAPIAVNRKHPMLQCSPPPCTGSTQVTLADLHKPGSGNAAGSFSLLDLIQGDNGNAGASTVAGWMTSGYDQNMPLGTYTAVPSAEFNNSQFQAALSSELGKEVLLPVYNPPVIEGGSNAQFNIVGWVGFVPTSTGGGGSSAAVNGHFTRFIAQGLQASDGSQSDFGARVIRLSQ